MTKKTQLIFLFIFILVVFSALAMLQSTDNYWKEDNRSIKIKFSHKFHLEQGIGCADCHTNAAGSTNSNDKLFGDHNSCSGCHQEQVDSECGYCHIKKDEPEGFDNPIREIIFSHKQHLELEDINCETCHKNLQEVDYANSENMPKMADCNFCHDNTKASNVCENCHTNFATLIPSDHLSSNFRNDHKRLVRVGAMETNCSTCHDEAFCQQCHDGSNLVKFGKIGLMSDFSPKTTRRDSPREFRLNFVHDLNYRFTHSIDAKSKQSDCYSCHNRETFCSECHQAGGNITQKSFKPLWHNEPNFKTFGVGSGGGTHAQLAKRDIESCASCHDAEGADPTCVQCHIDNDGIKGTNPKTHKSNYMKGEKGLWHETNSAVCYVCHTNPNANKDGNKSGPFCNYCHI